MAAAGGTNDLSSEMELDAYRRLFPLRFHEKHLLESIRPDGRPLGRARDTTLSLGLSLYCSRYLIMLPLLYIFKMSDLSQSRSCCICSWISSSKDRLHCKCVFVMA